MGSMARWTKPVEQLGDWFIGLLMSLGEFAKFTAHAVWLMVRHPWRFRLFMRQAEFVGAGSMFIVVLTGIFTGAVFTLQTVNALQRVGMESMVGTTVVLAVARELGPVLTALMVTGRVGSSMATELGTMRVTEQIDAMEVMAVDPIRYLVIPRLIACLLMVPALTLIFDAVAAMGSYAVAIGLLDIDQGSYLSRIEWYVDPADVVHGVYKAIVFGGFMALVGCYKGYHAEGGARGVGVATTQAVVIGSIGVFMLDYMLTSVLLAWGQIE